MDTQILAPIRYAAWLAGDLGTELLTTLEASLSGLPEVHIQKLHRGFLIQAEESPGPFLETVAQGMMKLEHMVSQTYPVFHREMGPVWTGTLQSVFPQCA
ncbi:MAG: hypothetical protein ACPHK8_04535 [Thermoplasmatota archaeon]